MSELGKRSSYTTGGTSSSATNGEGVGVGVDCDHVGSEEDFNFALLFELFEDGKTEINIPISDAEYADNLGFQEALMASFHKLKQTQIIRSEVKIEQNPDTTTTATTSRRIKEEPIEGVKLESKQNKLKRIKAEPIEGVTLELSDNFCGICKEMKRMGEIFIRRYAASSTSKCTHTFCFECSRKHIMAKIQENEIVIKCPELECQEILEPQSCQGLIPKEVFDRWGEAMSESLFIGSVKINCPFDDCKGMLVNDGGDAIRETECMHCRRLFCAQCKVPWHSDINCDDYQKLAGGT